MTRDGIPPRELRRIGRAQLAPYKTVRIEYAEARRARRVGRAFEVTLGDGRRLRCRKLLLASGVVDEVPDLEGIDALYGRSVFHCPYCDGWEFRHKPMAAYARGAHGLGLALELRAWSHDLVLCTDGPSRLKPEHVRRLADNQIELREDRITRLEGAKGRLERIVFADGQTLARRVLFFGAGQHQRCDLASELGCAFTGKGVVRTGKYEATNIPGLYVAGDASHLVQMAIVAAAEGAQAAFAINTALLKEDLR